MSIIIIIEYILEYVIFYFVVALYSFENIISRIKQLIFYWLCHSKVKKQKKNNFFEISAKN